MGPVPGTAIGLVSPSQSNPGDEVTAASVNDPVNQLAAVVNGNIETANLADSSVTTAKVAEGAITNAKLSTTAGEPGGAWLSWTPTFTNLSGGTLNYAKYTKVGKTVRFRLKYTLAGAGVAGAVTFTSPTTINSDYVAVSEPIPGSVSLFDSPASEYIGLMLWGSSTTIHLYVQVASGTYTAYGDLSSTIPFTWASGDVIAVSGFYEST